MSVKQSLLRSFAGGEITPELAWRVDLTKHQTGLKTARNFIVQAHGPASNRPGLGYVLELKDSTKKAVLLPFIYSTAQSYVLEFGDQYLRFHTNGGTLLESAVSITSATNANPGVFTKAGHGFSNGQWLYWSDMIGMTELAGRYLKVANATTDTFTLTDLAGNPINTSSYGAFVSGKAARVYEIATPYAEGDLYDLHFTQSADVLTIVHQSYQQRELARLGATDWTLTTESFTPTISAPAAPTVTASDAGSTTYTYVCTAVAADGLEESLASSSASTTNDLATSGRYNNIDPPAVTGAVRYNIYKKLNGLYGYIGQTDGSALRDDNIVPDTTKTPPEASDPFTSDYPRAVGYFQGRKWYGGTSAKPQNLWATRSGTEKNLSYSIPTRDDDSIAIRLTARQANIIRHIVPLGDLLLLTSGAEWLISSSDNGPITPSNIDPRPRDYIGASNVPPVVASEAVLYAADRGGRIREMKYKWESQGYATKDISIMAPHLFDAYTIRQMAYGRAPFSCVWAVRSDGTLLGMTYLPEHDVAAWHHHDTDGVFESVAVVPEGSEDVPYVIVKRTINGRDVRYIERMHSRAFESLADCFFVDAGATYDGSPTTTVSGLWHLVGEAVSILADGAVLPQQTVSANGTITLDNAASKVHVGLPYTADLETLPLAFEMQAYGLATKKNVNGVHLRLKDSSAIFVGPDFDNLTQFKQRSATEDYNDPPALYSGVAKVVTTPKWDEDATICLRQSKPLPVTVVGLVPEVA